MNLNITVDAQNTRSFLIELNAAVSDRTGLNDALGRRLARELVDHFRNKNSTPNRLGGTRTNFWSDVAEATTLSKVDESGAEVTVADSRFRIHLFGGVIRPTAGRKFLTIPLIAEAHGLRVREYESLTGKKLFKPPGKNVLMERSGAATENYNGGVGRIRSRSGFRNISIRQNSPARAVYFLTARSTIKADPSALPPAEKLISALMETGDDFISRELSKGGAS